MGITSAWAISAHRDSVVGELAPRVLPLIAAERDVPYARERWQRWQRAPLPSHRTWYGADAETAAAVDSFCELTAPGEHIQQLYGGAGPEDDFWIVDDVWEPDESPDRMFLSVQSKDFALRAFFHAIGPVRAARIPGWCGNFLLTSAQVCATLPEVERALTFTAEERAAADDQNWLDESTDENVLDGPLRQWRQAAEAGLGLFGANLQIY
ncbi:MULTISPECIES: hypothetical protein [unclassified Streptomyces]|uniref:Uncharacterized protein n=1 Tax=Streptomyces sp. NBC_00060 TaxID=2975636 RepID=A0AAU2HC93_9ACTN